MITPQLEAQFTCPRRTLEVVNLVDMDGALLKGYWPPANTHPLFQVSAQPGRDWLTLAQAEMLRDSLHILLTP
jgi:hypothetical protein